MAETGSATWKRRVKKWRRWAAEMAEDAGAAVHFPEDLDVPPHRRIAITSTDQV